MAYPQCDADMIPWLKEENTRLRAEIATLRGELAEVKLRLSVERNATAITKKSEPDISGP